MTGYDCFCTEDNVVAGCSVHDGRRGQLLTGRMTETPISPDCRDGNHTKCPGDAWDLEKDELAGCRCKCGCG
jgi:hypothetical protein